MQANMQRENGAEEAVKSFYRHLPVQQMRCDLDHERMATKWSESDGVKFCERCNLLRRSRPENHWKDVVEYHSVDYAARGQELANLTRFTTAPPPPGMAVFLQEVGWAVACMNHVGGVVRDVSQFLLLSCFTSWDVAAFHKEPATHAQSPAVQNALEDVQTAGIAVHGPDGRIRMDVAEEENIDLEALRRQSLSTMDSEEDARLADTTLPPVMNICIMIVGTRGDVQPFIAIAKRLQQDGHRVRVATHAIYRAFVTNYGVEFYPLGGDPKELAAYMVKTGGHLIPL
ncbi:hypothetical protein BBJ28_00026605, partial [Nothophytophthora sp. Chile5]